MNTMLYQIVSNPLSVIAFVSNQAPGAISRPSDLGSFNRSMFHEFKERRCIMRFAGSKGYRYRLTFSFRPEMDLGREPTSTTTKSFFSLPPFFVPAAFW